jgi:hypothetical protein
MLAVASELFTCGTEPLVKVSFLGQQYSVGAGINLVLTLKTRK